MSSSSQLAASDFESANDIFTREQIVAEPNKDYVRYFDLHELLLDVDSVQADALPFTIAANLY